MECIQLAILFLGATDRTAQVHVTCSSTCSRISTHSRGTSPGSKYTRARRSYLSQSFRPGIEAPLAPIAEESSEETNQEVTKVKDEYNPSQSFFDLVYPDPQQTEPQEITTSNAPDVKEEDQDPADDPADNDDNKSAVEGDWEYLCGLIPMYEDGGNSLLPVHYKCVHNPEHHMHPDLKVAALFSTTLNKHMINKCQHVHHILGRDGRRHSDRIVDLAAASRIYRTLRSGGWPRTRDNTITISVEDWHTACDTLTDGEETSPHNKIWLCAQRMKHMDKH